jgi:MATE family multidrug resistance protein
MMKNTYSFKADIYPLVHLAIPLAMTGMVQSAPFFFQTIFLAHLGPETLAAGALVSWFFGTLAVILFGTMSAINILVAHKHGAKDDHGLAQVARDGLVLSMLLAIPSTFLLWNMAPIFLLFGQPPAVVALAQAYVHALTWGLIAMFLTMAILEVVIGTGHARIVLIMSVISVTINIIASYILIFGKFGFPELGIAGAGWGTTISYWVTFIIFVGFVLANKTQRNYFRYIGRFEKPCYLWELIQIGVPTGVMYCVEVAFFFALTLAMGVLSTEIQAANQVALQYLGLMMSSMFAVAQAITVRMGHLLGAGEAHAAEKASDIGVTLAVSFISLVAIIYWVFPEKLISVDFNVTDPRNVGIVAVIKDFLIICALFQIIETARIALFGSLRGLKDTRFTMLTSILSFWGIALPVGYILAIHLHMGGTGYWWGMVLGASISVVLLHWRFKKKMRHYYLMGAR